MTQLIDIDTALDAISHAFEPLRCVVEVYGYRARVRYQVFGHSNTTVASVCGVQVRDVLSPTGLVAEIDKTRTRLEHQGFVLKVLDSLP
jgi:hypothetical protein